MPYLQVDLDALDDFDGAATMAGITEGEIAIGLLKLWRHCWKGKTDVVHPEFISSCFRGDRDRIIVALVIREFLAKLPDGTLGVRGADKRLGITRARQKAAEKTNAARRTRELPVLSEPPVPVVEAVSTVQSTDAGPCGRPTLDRAVDREGTVRSTHGLTSSIQHPASKEEEKKLSSPLAPQTELEPEEPEADEPEPADDFTADVERLIGHYVEVMKANDVEARSTRKRRGLIRTRLREGYKPEELLDAINGLTWSDYHMREGYTDLAYAIKDARQIDMMKARLRQGTTNAQQARRL